MFAFAIVLALAASPIQGHRSLYSQIVARSEPTNGYEDYLRAADLVYDRDFNGYITFSSDSYPRELKSKKFIQEQEKQGKTYDRDDPLGGKGIPYQWTDAMEAN